jgi:hypothetical protein
MNTLRAWEFENRRDGRLLFILTGDNSFKPLNVPGKLGHPIATKASLFFIRELQPAHRFRKISFLPRDDTQRIMASDEHLVSPFGKWKLCGFVGGVKKPVKESTAIHGMSFRHRVLESAPVS